MGSRLRINRKRHMTAVFVDGRYAGNTVAGEVREWWRDSPVRSWRVFPPCDPRHGLGCADSDAQAIRKLIQHAAASPECTRGAADMPHETWLWLKACH